MAGSSVALDEELAPPLLAEPELGCAALLALESDDFCSLGAALELELELDGVEGVALGVALEPPEAEPDLPASMFTDVELDEPGVAVEPEGAAELDEDEPGVAGAAVPPEAELDEEPGAVDGDDGVALSLLAVLELEEPGAEDVRLAFLSPQAARPRAIATATVRMESFMCPPWLGYRTRQQYVRPG